MHRQAEKSTRSVTFQRSKALPTGQVAIAPYEQRRHPVGVAPAIPLVCRTADRFIFITPIAHRLSDCPTTRSTDARSAWPRRFRRCTAMRIVSRHQSRTGCRIVRRIFGLAAGADVGIGSGVASREQLTAETTAHGRLRSSSRIGNLPPRFAASRHFYWQHFFFTVTPKNKSLYFINVSLVYHVQCSCESGERKPRIPSGIEGWAGSFPPLFFGCPPVAR
jgi:hypothetical protein